MAVKPWNQISKGKVARQNERDRRAAQQQRWEDEAKAREERRLSQPPKRQTLNTVVLAAMVGMLGVGITRANERAGRKS